MTTKFSKSEMENAKNYLLSILPPGKKIYGDVVHVSRSGMYRVIRLKTVVDDSIVDISWAAAKLLEGWDDHHYGCRASGCGMDMVFHLIYTLGWVLYPNGEWECIGEHCPHNDHSNRPYPKREKGVMHKANGYIFRYER